MGLQKGSGPLHDPYQAQAQSANKNTSKYEVIQHDMNYLLRYYFEHPSGNEKSDSYKPPVSKW